MSVAVPERVRIGRRAAALTLAGVVLFWVLHFGGGALVPGYDPRVDYISALASRGSSAAPFGMAAIAALGCAHLAGAFAARAAWPRRTLVVPMALCGLFVLCVAAFRIRCPHGAAGCGFGTNIAPDDLYDTVHFGATLAFQASLLAAMAVLAVGAWRGAPWPRWLGLVSVPLAVVSVVLLARTGGADNGLLQRSWAAVNQAWLLVVVWAALRATRA